MEQRNIIKWNDDNTLSIPAGEIWMSESELVEIFGKPQPCNIFASFQQQIFQFFVFLYDNLPCFGSQVATFWLRPQYHQLLAFVFFPLATQPVF